MATWVDEQTAPGRFMSEVQPRAVKEAVTIQAHQQALTMIREGHSEIDRLTEKVEKLELLVASQQAVIACQKDEIDYLKGQLRIELYRSRK